MKAKNLVLGLSAALLLLPLSYAYADGVTKGQFNRAGAGLGKSGSQANAPQIGWYSFSSHSGPFVSKDGGRDNNNSWDNDGRAGGRHNDWNGWPQSNWRSDHEDNGNHCGHYKGYQGSSRHFSSNQGTSSKSCNKY